MIVLNGQQRQAWETVEIDSENSFELLVEKPTFAEHLAEYGNRTVKDVAGLMESMIKGWRGVNSKEIGEGGKEIEVELAYSFEDLKKLCEIYPVAFHRISALVSDCFFGRARPRSAPTLSDGAEAQAESPSLIPE